MDVTVTDSMLVKPVNPTPHHQLWFSNIDFVMVRCHSPIAYIYRRPPNGDSNVAQILRDGLSKVLVDFYPTIDDFEDFTSPSQLTTLVPSATYDNGEIVSNPLWYSAEKIHESIAKMDDEYLRSVLNFLELQPDLNADLLQKDTATFCQSLQMTGVCQFAWDY
ncbi:hypothetical protein SUGI_0426570 [Cryptomeria japonica]|nr:hypothetical protein SUGI_0426570 [Cryptomeria japonica]